TNGSVLTLPYHGIESYANWKPNADFLAGVPQVDWEKVHPDMIVTGMCNMGRYQTLSRLLQVILCRSQMYTFGRLQATVFCDATTVDQSKTLHGERGFRPVSIWTHGTAELEVLDTMPADSFWLPTKKEMKVVRITPLVHPLITAPVETVQHIMILLFTKKRQPLSVAIKAVAPSAEELLVGMNIDPNQPPYTMTVAQMNELAWRFERWAHRPPTLESALST
ncbi:hypothetical protein THASP1DRAFT_26741, partial [Thamnocephalis sphaerospora]